MSSLPACFSTLLQKADLPILVDFYADWCGPCKMLAPVISTLAKEYKGRILTIKINTDHKQDIAQTFQIRSIPTIMMFHKGTSIMRLEGALPYTTLKAEIDLALAKSKV